MRNLTHALADCLDAVRDGEPLEASLNRYPPRLHDSLKPLLEVAQALSAAPARVQPSPSFVTQLRSKLMAA